MVDTRVLMKASAGGATHVLAWRCPVVDFIATGDELCAPGGAAATASLVPDSLSGPLLMAVRQWGGIPGEAELLPDQREAITAAAHDAVSRSVVLLLAGGASTGDRDFARQALAAIGLELEFTKVAIKPAKPVWYGRVGANHILGLPGNPAAALITARLFLARLLYHLGGRDARRALDWRAVPLAAAMAENGPRETFVGARHAALGAGPIEGLTASSQLLMSQAELLIRRAPGVPALAASAAVSVLRL